MRKREGKWKRNGKKKEGENKVQECAKTILIHLRERKKKRFHFFFYQKILSLHIFFAKLLSKNYIFDAGYVYWRMRKFPESFLSFSFYCPFGSWG